MKVFVLLYGGSILFVDCERDSCLPLHTPRNPLFYLLFLGEAFQNFILFI